VCQLAVVGYAASRSGAAAGASAAAGVCLAALLAGGIVLRKPGVVPWSLFGAGALYVATLRGGLDGWSLGVAAGLLLAAELSYWSIGHERLLYEEPAVALRHAAGIAALVAATLAGGFVVLTTAGLQLAAGLPLAAAGAVAAVGLLLLIARLARAG
jgi:hypothetical protein